MEHGAGKKHLGKSAPEGESFVYDYGKGREWGTMRLKVALGFPSEYSVGMSNLGFLWVYHLINSEEGVRCDRFFFPGGDVSGGRAPRTETIEAGRRLCDYDVVAFSLPYEQDYPRLVWLLKSGGVEPVAEKRHGFPIVIAGGVAVSANPEPLADFLDAVVIGEAEDALTPLIEAIAGMKKSGIEGAAALRELQKINGVYVPALYKISYKADGTIEKILPEKIVQAGFLKKIVEPAHSPIIAGGAAFSGMFLVELSRGCPHSCRFCLTRYAGHGFRAASADRLVEVVSKGLKHSNRIGLVGTAFAEARAADAVCGAVSEGEGHVSFSSLRLTDRVIELFEKWGAIIDNETLAIAPEVATERLKKALDKDIEQSVGRFLEGPFPKAVRNLKLYYMAGVPGETDDDVRAIAAEAEGVRKKIARRGVRVSLSVNPLTPKAHTPMQWMKMPEQKIVRARIAGLKRELGGRGVPVSGMGVRDAEMQGVLSMGDRRLGPAIADVAERGSFSASDFAAAMKMNGLHSDFYLRREKEKNEILPWSMISHGVARERLWEQYVEATEAAR